MEQTKLQELKRIAANVRLGALECVYNAASGHPGGALSIADILTYLYFAHMHIDPKNPTWSERDRFVLSKGHTCPALYAVLAEKGYFPKADLKTFRQIDSYLQGHPDMKQTPGVDMTSGSLGLGISAACGMALSGKIDRKTYRVYSILGDGEVEEGQVWEAAMFAAHYQLDNLCAFVDVNGLQIDGPTEKVMNLGYLAELLYSTKTAETTYTVKAGDTWSEIAEDHGMTSKELLALNPGYNIDKIQIGEVLTLSEAVPYLTVTVKQREYYVEDVMYDVEYTDSAYLYKGDYQVTSPGEYGAADVVANVTYVNGVETERTILSSVTLKEPVTEQRLQGTKERPTWLPTGTFRWPISGRITSRFGGRSSPGGIGSTNHQGIDIAGPYGTPVYAADGGTVTYSGWMGGYGYLVEINHGNGYVTRYGHNSSLTVSVGDHVYKGQQIARVGSTGNSTGNHCHFEVRYNGVARNPLNYLP